MYDETVTILDNRKVNAEYYKLSFRSKRLAKNVLPGQFLQMKIEEGYDPFLRRPFSYYRTVGDRVEILYEILGMGTKLLTEKGKGGTLKVLGPLGRGFSRHVERKKRILVGGGVGVPPLVFLAERYDCYQFLIGTKSRKEILPSSEIKKFAKTVRYTTEDGSFGKKGLVTNLLEDLLKKEKGNPQDYFIQTCGPNRMMERVMEIADHHGIEGEASWDETMACGVGVCLGCMVLTRKGWTASCKEGPVFRFDEMEKGH
ncbi:MAG: dihydroorotate dehydrogenase electron transfer subunit [Candidatus Omnitrophica bacterium]|nr:dihydroorotate dehydrogenase electron transfer subunit [Candidatus Omnitrophota bacterium]